MRQIATVKTGFPKIDWSNLRGPTWRASNRTTSPLLETYQPIDPSTLTRWKKINSYSLACLHTWECCLKLAWTRAVPVCKLLFRHVPFPGWGRVYTHIWLKRGCAAGHGMVFNLFVLNRVYNFYVSVINRVCILSFVLNINMDLKWRVLS